MKTHAQKKLSDNSFYLKEKNKLVKINLDEIIAFESKLHKVIVHTLETKIIFDLSLEKIKQLLADRKQFIQIHRSFIISENFIKSIEGNAVDLSNHIKITIGRLYKKDFEEMINAKLLR